MPRSASHSSTELADLPGRYALVTVATIPYLPGVGVMIHSFIEQNSWFAGDIVVLTEPEAAAELEVLHTYENIRIRPVGQRLLDRAATVQAEVADRTIMPARFYSLEAFALGEYERLVFLDADVLVTGDLTDLFRQTTELAAVGDAFHYRDKLRTGPDYRPHTLRFWQRRSNYWSGLFNSGVLSVGSTHLTGADHDQLLMMVDPGRFSGDVPRFHDQLLLNVHFYGRVTLLPAHFNYRVGIAEEILEKDGIEFLDARVLHFTARHKPWVREEASRLTAKGGNYERSLQLWRAAHEELPIELRVGIRRIVDAFNRKPVRP